MSTKRKPAVHYCTQEELLKRIGLVLFGDGTPEDGLSFMFREFMKDHIRVVADITEIKGKVTQAIETAGTTGRALELYKQENKSFDEGVKDRETRDNIAIALEVTRKRDKRSLIFSIIMAVLTLTAVCYSILKGTQDRDKVVNKIDNQGVPVVVNKRGQMIILPDSAQIKYFPNDTAFLIKKMKSK